MNLSKTLIFLISVISILHVAKTSACESDYCGSFSFHYPFKLSTSQPQNICSYKNLKCNSTLGLGTPAVNLPYGGDYFVRGIMYDEIDGPFIQLYDPGDCLMGRLMHEFNLSSSPYKAIMYENYTYYSCPSDLDVGNLALPIRCLSNSTYSTLAIASSSISQDMVLGYGCDVIGTWLLPVSRRFQFSFDGVNDDLYLTWNSTTCSACEETHDQQILDDSTSDQHKSNWWVKFTQSNYSTPVFAALSFIITICVLELAKCFRKNRDRANPQSLPTNVTGEPAPAGPIMTTGLDKLKINFCTKLVVLSESKKIPGPDSDVTCSICLDSYEEGETVRSIAKCEHYFHAHCIELWLGKNSTCPVCRTTVLIVSES